MWFLILGCGDDVNLHRAPGDPADVAPIVELSPSLLDFGALELGAVAELPLTVTNVGASTLSVSDLALTGSGAFRIVEADHTATLEPEASATFHVEFTPTNPEDVGSVVVTSDDPFDPVVAATLSGTAIVPELTAWPDPLDFGAIPDGCLLTRPLYVANTGTADLEVASVVADNAAFVVSADTPFTLAPGEQVELSVTFTAASADAASGAIYLTSNDLLGFTTVDTTGAGGAIQDVTDTFAQGEQEFDSADILLYVDGSGSMSDDQANLSANFGTFVEALGEAELDWQMIVVTDDDGCHNGPIFTADTINTTELLEAVRGPVGTFTEAGLWLTRAALADTSGCNDGWIREGARTTAILVSDESEQSPGRTAEIVADIQALAPSAVLNGIAGDVPDGCETAEPGAGYNRAATLTGGVFLSICDADWASYFETIAARTGSDLTDTFPLSAWPAPGSLSVKVNGEAAEGWNYDTDANAVVFDADALPPAAASVVVSYRLDATCP